MTNSKNKTVCNIEKQVVIIDFPLKHTVLYTVFISITLLSDIIYLKKRSRVELLFFYRISFN